MTSIRLTGKTDQPLVHAWSEGDRPKCGGVMERGDSLHTDKFSVTCSDCCALVVEGFPRSYIGKPVGPPSQGRRDIKTVRSPAVDAFLTEIEAVCTRHGMALLPIEEGIDRVGEFRVIKVKGSDWKTTEAGEKLRNAEIDGASFEFKTP